MTQLRTAAIAAFLALAIALPAAAEPTGAAPASRAGAHAFAFEAIDGGRIELADFAGGPVLVVNTASRCGFTPQYEGLQTLWERYGEAGLVVLGVPSNDFGQELDSDGEVLGFCTAEFGVSFPLAARQRVRGPDAHPFYRWARDELGPLDAPRWNFHKYLLDGEGRLVAAFPSSVHPLDETIVAAIEGQIGTARGD